MFPRDWNPPPTPVGNSLILLLSPQIVANNPAAFIDFNGLFSSLYDEYLFIIADASPAANSTFAARVIQDGVVKTAANYSYICPFFDTVPTVTAIGSAASTNIILTANDQVSNVIANSFSGKFSIFNPLSTVNYKKCTFNGTWQGVTGASTAGGGYYQGDTNPVSGVRFYFPSANIARATIAAYGVKKF